MEYQKATQIRESVSGCESYNTQMLYFTCSSLSADDQRIYLISDRDGSPNVYVRDLNSKEERKLTQNTTGVLKSYVYFDGTEGKGLGKASVSLDSVRDLLYFIQDDQICKVNLQGEVTVLNKVPDRRFTAFTHPSADGKYLCVPMTDHRALDFDPETEGAGLDKRPVYNIDQRVQDENLSSYLCVYDVHSGALVYEKEVPKSWITHVQFHPLNSEIIMYNHEWAAFDCGIRRIWTYNHETDVIAPVREEGPQNNGFDRSRNDWVCHEMWSDDGRYIIYHGAYQNDGAAFVGRKDTLTNTFVEIALPPDYNAYGHFLMAHNGDLVCDGYFKFPWEIKPVRENSTDNGPDPHKKDAEYICQVIPDWNQGKLEWIPLCKHESDWLGQDAHPHPIYSHHGEWIYFSSRNQKKVQVYRVKCLENGNK